MLLSQGIEPLFADIDPLTWNLSPEKCEALIRPETRAIVATHLWRRPCEIGSLQALADRYDLELIFDAAHAFGCSHQGEMIAKFGRAEVFSFHATKIFHTFEGGAVTTQDPNLAEQLRSLRNFGFSGPDQVEALGLNAKMPEVCAAMGLASLESLDASIERCRETYEAYKLEFATIPGLSLLAYDRTEKNNFQYVVIEVDEAICGISRDRLMQSLHAENVLARRYFYPGNHRMEPYRSQDPEADQRLANTNAIAQTVMILPAATGVSLTEISEICALIRLIIASSSA